MADSIIKVYSGTNGKIVIDKGNGKFGSASPSNINVRYVTGVPFSIYGGRVFLSVTGDVSLGFSDVYPDIIRDQAGDKIGGGDAQTIDEVEAYFDELGISSNTGGGTGERGYSAYEIAVQNGFVGTEQQWLASLKGQQGEPGQPGTPGTPGSDASVTTQNITSALGYTPQSNLIPFNPQTGTSYTAVLSDNGKAIQMNNAAANTFVLPLNSAVPFPIGTQLLIEQAGTGQTTIAATSGVTINQRQAFTKTAGQYALATLIKKASDTWVLSGDLVL